MVIIKKLLISSLVLILLLGSLGLYTNTSQAFSVEYDKIVHFRTFAAMTIGIKHVTGWDDELILKHMAVLGFLDEYIIQRYFTPTVGTEFEDVVADIAGTLFGLYLYNNIFTFWESGERPYLGGRLSAGPGLLNSGKNARLEYKLSESFTLLGEGYSYKLEKASINIARLVFEKNLSSGWVIYVGGFQLSVVDKPTLVYWGFYKQFGGGKNWNIDDKTNAYARIGFMSFIPGTYSIFSEEGSIDNTLTPEGINPVYNFGVERMISDQFFTRLDFMHMKPVGLSLTLSLGIEF